MAVTEKIGFKSRLAMIKKDQVGYLFALPYLILFFTFTVLPIGISIFFSLTDFNSISIRNFVGFDNYIRLILNDDIFIIALKNTLIFASITGPIGYLLCFFFAWAVNEIRPKLRAFLTLCFYAPSISGNAYLIWTLLFNGDSYGYVNSILLKMGLINSPIRYFHDPKYMMTICILVVLWLSLGTSFLVFIAGFQGIDKTLYEAAAVDGVRSRWQELWYITVPSMKPQMMFGAVMSITSSFGIGDVLTGLVGFPSTQYAVHTIQHHLQDYGGARFEMGYASAIATVLFALMLGSNLLVQKMLSKVGE
ncbi:MAG: sugar ABC transporter permease [Oscillospiraceae bacterium]|nr:sugar ABC transporter permease [Oscillospiraceae bacterium]MDD4413524.1 sugar ABC transporter permease [Oscillospiraceae bacterium]